MTADPSTAAIRRELYMAVALGAVLVMARSLVFAIFAHAHFDSDQAIVGLMAKHLSEGRAFPLFFYGQSYLLGIEAWLMAPVFLLAGPTVAAMRASLILTNLSIATVLIVGLHRSSGLRPGLALVASLPFVFAPPLTSAQLVEASGQVEPLLFILLLWSVRTRPVWLGAILAVAVLTREFSIYAVPVLLTLEWWRGRLLDRETLQRWLVATVAFVVVWDVVLALLPYSHVMGPGTAGQLLSGFSGSQVANVLDRVELNPLTWPARAAIFFGHHLPLLVGGVPVESGLGNQGRAWMLPAMAALIVLGVGRLFRLGGRGRCGLGVSPMGWYLLGVGLMACAAYVVTRPVGEPVLRYYLLALFVPIGFLAVWLAAEPRRWIRGAVVGATLVWAAISASDNADHFSRFATGQLPNDQGAIAEALVRSGVSTARSDYWGAYKFTFLTGERVRIASTDFVRIQEYQSIADAAEPGVPILQAGACPGGRAVSTWYLCPAPEARR